MVREGFQFDDKKVFRDRATPPDTHLILCKNFLNNQKNGHRL